MKCGICNSEEHFRAECPQRSQQHGFVSFQSRSHDSADNVIGPLGDIVSESFQGMVTSTFAAASAQRSQRSNREPASPPNSAAWWSWSHNQAWNVQSNPIMPDATRGLDSVAHWPGMPVLSTRPPPGPSTSTASSSSPAAHFSFPSMPRPPNEAQRYTLDLRRFLQNRASLVDNFVR